MRRAWLIFVVAALSVFPQQKRPDIADQTKSDGMISQLAGGYKFLTGVIWSRDGFLLFSDTPTGRVMKITTQGSETFRDGLAGPQGLAIDDEGRVYVCETRARRVIRVDKKGRVQVIADKWEGKRLNGPNDMVLTKDNHVFFTDPAFASADQSKELDFYGVYHVSPRGEIAVAARFDGRPNGIALSPDGTTLYVADSDRRAVLAFDLAKSGALTNQRVLIRGIDGVPDGIRVARSGELYLGARDLLVFSPDGKPIRTIPFREKPSSCAFGDGDMNTLYIAAGTSIYKTRLDGEGPH